MRRTMTVEQIVDAAEAWWRRGVDGLRMADLAAALASSRRPCLARSDLFA